MLIVNRRVKERQLDSRLTKIISSLSFPFIRSSLPPLMNYRSARLTLVFSTLLTSWSPGYFLGVPIAGYLLEAAGGPEGGIAAFGPAIWYAGGLSSLSTALLSVPKIIEVRKRRKERAEQ